MDNLHLDTKLAAAVVEDEDTDAAAARVERGLEALPEVGLVNDGEILLDVSGLGHGDDLDVLIRIVLARGGLDVGVDGEGVMELTVSLLHVEHAVLLEDGAEHGLDNNTGGGVSNEGALLVELLGEQIHTEVPVLAGGSRGGDADDLARALLEHQEVADADVVAGNRDRVRHDGRVALATLAAGRTTGLTPLSAVAAMGVAAVVAARV